jgi:uncharacterized protein (TIGR02145 family)
MTKNLNTQKFRNGDIIPEAKTINEWKDFVTNKQAAWCYLQFNPSNGLKYGKIYNWYAIADPRGLSPVDWHIPSKQEITDLISYGPAALKSTVGWESYTLTYPVEDSRGILVGYKDRVWSGNGNNKTGFSSLPGGYLYSNFITNSTGWWSYTKLDPNEIYFNGMERYTDKIKINLFQNDEQVSKGLIEGKLSIENNYGKISYFKEGKRIKIVPTFDFRDLVIAKEDAFSVTDINGNFKFKNIPTGRFDFEVYYDGDNPYYDLKTTISSISYDNLKGLQKDLSYSSVLFMASNDSESKIKPQEIEFGFYVRCVKDQVIIQTKKN